MLDEPFIAVSSHLQEIKKLATLLATIKTNVLITGEPGVGKLTVAKLIAPKAPVIRTDVSTDIAHALKNTDEVIIPHIDQIKNLDLIPPTGGRIIATTTSHLKQSLIDKYFGMTIEVLPLSAHPEDIIPLTQRFVKEACTLFRSDATFDPSALPCDISANAHSLKRAIYQHVLMGNLDQSSVEMLLENYFLDNYPACDAYDDMLAIFDSAIIKASHRLFGSQLAMAARLGINRNTLRKKITELDLRLKDD